MVSSLLHGMPGKASTSNQHQVIAALIHQVDLGVIQVEARTGQFDHGVEQCVHFQQSGDCHTDFSDGLQFVEIALNTLVQAVVFYRSGHLCG
jgi:hypothetical protein